MVQLGKLFSPAENLDAGEAKKFMAEHPEGSYILLDVRQPAEYEEEHLAGARLIPLGQLGDAVTELPKDKPIITYCAIGGRSRVAAQLLQGYGFQKVYNLKGGIKAWQGYKASGPEELHLDLVRGDETPAEVAKLAMGMEESLKKFYQTLLTTATDGEVRALFEKMVEVSELHKRRFGDFLEQWEPGRKRVDTAAEVETEIMEGGYNLKEFLEKNGPYMETLPGALDVAMMLETQALDLYRRLAERAEVAGTRDFLMQVSQEEKVHLNLLGDLLEAKVKAGG